jgi:hypothetical protein
MSVYGLPAPWIKKSVNGHIIASDNKAGTFGAFASSYPSTDEFETVAAKELGVACVSLADQKTSWAALAELGAKLFLRVASEKAGEEYEFLKCLRANKIVPNVKQLLLHLKCIQSHLDDVLFLNATHLLVHIRPDNRGYYFKTKGGSLLPTSAEFTYVRRDATDDTKPRLTAAPIPDPFLDEPFEPELPQLCIFWPEKFVFPVPHAGLLPQGSLSAESLVGSAKALTAAGNYKGALAVTGYVTSRYPAHCEAFEAVADAFVLLKMHQFSFYFYDQAAAIGGKKQPKLALPCLEMAKRAAECGDAEGAMALAIKSITVAEHDERVWLDSLTLISATGKVRFFWPMLLNKAMFAGPTMPGYCDELLRVLCASDMESEAVELHAALPRIPLSKAAVSAVAMAMVKCGQHERALDLVNGPGITESDALLSATVIFETGCDTARCLAGLLAAFRSDPVANSKILSVVPYDGEQNPASIKELHCQWFLRLSAPAAQKEEEEKKKKKGGRSGGKLRVGFLVANDDCVSGYLDMFIAHHSRGAVQLHFFSPMTPFDTEGAVQWHSTVGRSFRQTAEDAAAAEMDVMVDLLGHRASGSVEVLAYRPAPVCVSMPTYATTTGISGDGMFRITDAVADSGESDAFYSETLMRLPGSCLCYYPSGPTPFPERTAAQDSVVFGSLHSIQRVTPETAKLWCHILDAVPGATLAVYSHSAACLAEAGLPQKRVTIIPAPIHRRTHLDNFNRIDCLLDTVPFSDHQVVCESLAMGVPVVTMTGETFVHNSSNSVLRAAGIFGYTASTATQYVALATHARPATTAARERLARRFLTSPFCDSKAYVAKLEAAFADLCDC